MLRPTSARLVIPPARRAVVGCVAGAVLVAGITVVLAGSGVAGDPSRVLAVGALISALAVVGASHLALQRRAAAGAGALEVAEARARFEMMIDRSGVLMVVVGTDGRVRSVSGCWELLVGRDRTEAIGGDLFGWLRPDEEAAGDLLRRALAVPGARASARCRILHQDGSARWVEALATNLAHAAAAGGALITTRDVTAEIAAQAAFDHAQARFAALVEHGSDLITLSDGDGRLRYASPALRRVLDLDPVDQIGRRLLNLVHPDDHDVAARYLDQVTERSEPPPPVECRLIHGDGGWRHVELTAANRLADPAVGAVVCNMRDITERVQVAERLHHLAMHDSLTGLPNRALLLEWMDEALRQARAGRTRCMVLYVDLDGFKKVNDSLGHAAGDAVLCAVANRLRDAVRPTDVVSRLGGDEFVVVLADVSLPTSALQVAERIRAAVAYPVRLGHRSVTVGCSIGIAISHQHVQPPQDLLLAHDQRSSGGLGPSGPLSGLPGPSGPLSGLPGPSGPLSGAPDQYRPAEHGPAALLQEADTALYRAKDRGRNRWEVYDQGMRTEARRRLDTEELLRHALDDDGLVIVYQPIVDLADGALVGVEALLRLRGRHGELVGPAEFIDVAEESGLIVPVGAGVLDLACRQAAVWNTGPRANRPLRVAVNISPRQLANPGLVAQVRHTLAAWELPADQLCLELTENALIDAGLSVRSSLRALKEMGVSIAIDDFGTGWSSLGYLRRFPVDVVKIDRSFVAGLGVDDGDTEVVRAVVGLGLALGLTVVAEGVETPSQAALLRELGCNRAQGYLYGRPAGPEMIAVGPLTAVRGRELAEVDGNRTRRTGSTRPTRFEGGGAHQVPGHLPVNAEPNPSVTPQVVAH